MQTWIIYAIISMIFAGLTSVLAKYGLQNISTDFGLRYKDNCNFRNHYYRQCDRSKIQGVRQSHQFTNYASCCFQYNNNLKLDILLPSMKDGLVSYVAAIDKASILITLVLSFMLLKEPMTPKIIIGGCLIFAGMIVLIWK